MRRLLRSEWTKLWSVRRWAIAMFGMIALTVVFIVLTSNSGSSNANDYPDFVVGPTGRPVTDEFEFVHQSLTGDGSVTARVATQTNSHEWAGAGVIMKDGVKSGSRYTALMVTPSHGVRLSSDYYTTVDGGSAGAPQWLRLTRSGTSISGYRSADGVTWQQVGTVDAHRLPATIEVGLFVSSPEALKVERSAGGTSVSGHATQGEATFDGVRIESAQARPDQSWIGTALFRPLTPAQQADVDRAKAQPQGQRKPSGGGPGTFRESNGTFTVFGSGAIGPREPADDMVEYALFSTFLGLLAILAVGVLFITSEYRRGLIRTTFAATPARGRVLAAKAVVIGGSSFVIGLVACVVAIVIGFPNMKRHGLAPPAYPTPSLTEGTTVRAILLTSAFVALVALFGLGVGTIMRRSAGAITTVIALVILPVFVAVPLPLSTAQWLLRLTPAGGLAAERAKPPSIEVAEPWATISPWVGIGAVAAYAAVALAVGTWLIRRRDTA